MRCIAPMLRPATSRSMRAGLTMVEVLVILGIVGTLLGIMLPALSTMRTSTRQALCQSNLRQMAIAAQTYATLWDAHPTALRYEQVDGVALRVAWDWVTTFSGQVIAPGPLWQFTDHPDRVMQCPGYAGPSNFDGDPYTGYNYNTDYIGGEATTTAFGWSVVRRGVAPHACVSPSGTAIFGLGGYSGGANKFMRSPDNPHHLSPSITYAGGQALLYNGTTNVAFLDAHVESRQTLHDGPQTESSLLTLLGWPLNGFLSEDGSAYNPRVAGSAEPSS